MRERAPARAPARARAPRGTARASQRCWQWRLRRGQVRPLDARGRPLQEAGRAAARGAGTLPAVGLAPRSALPPAPDTVSRGGCVSDRAGRGPGRAAELGLPAPPRPGRGRVSRLAKLPGFAFSPRQPSRCRGHGRAPRVPRSETLNVWRCRARGRWRHRARNTASPLPQE